MQMKVCYETATKFRNLKFSKLCISGKISWTSDSTCSLAWIKNKKTRLSVQIDVDTLFFFSWLPGPSFESQHHLVNEKADFI